MHIVTGVGEFSEPAVEVKTTVDMILSISNIELANN